MSARTCPRCQVGAVAPRCRICDACAGFTAGPAGTYDPTGVTILLVPDENCPGCYQPGSPKVTDADNVCWWKCLSGRLDCAIAYYEPISGRTELRLSEAEEAESKARIKAEVDAMMVGRTWVKTSGDHPIETWALAPIAPEEASA